MRALMFTVLVGFPIFLSGCDDRGDYNKTVESGKRSIPWVVFIGKSLNHADVDHFITHWGVNRAESVEWRTNIYFYGRYKMALSQ